MATSLKLISTDANSNAVTTNVNYVNENCADSDLKLFATNLFSLSDNTLNEVYKITTTDITNAEPEPTGNYALWTPSAKFYDINNTDFLNALIHNYTSPPTDSIAAINSITPITNALSIKATRESGVVDTYIISSLFIFAKDAIRVLVTGRRSSTFQTIVSDSGFIIPTLAENLGLSLQDIADMIMQNKTVQLLAQALIFANESLDSKYEKHANISYVQATNSIRVDPIEGFEDDFALRLTNPSPMVVYDEQEYYVPDPAYSDGQSLGLNTKVTLDEDDNSIYIDLGIFEI